jgi:N-acetyl-gamma-glutamyl-phosphate reductase
MQKQIRVGVLGVSGYTGICLLNLLNSHSHIQIRALASNQHIGKKISDIYPGFTNIDLPELIATDNLPWKDLDCLFTATPNGIASSLVEAALKADIKLIDLAADFRLKDHMAFEKWYAPLKAPNNEYLQKAVYGLCEFNRAHIKQAQILANPGCYPTASALAILPLLKNKLIDSSFCIIDAKSGTTGAGKKAEEHILFSEINESFSAYKVMKHRHIPEIEASLEEFTGEKMPIRFTPHLLPIKRGILCTTYLKPKNTISNHSLKECFQMTYKNELFVKIVDELPKTKDIYAAYDERTNLVVVISVIDNLMKGAAGQALQNFNLMFDFPEDTGLKNLRFIP